MRDAEGATEPASGQLAKRTRSLFVRGSASIGCTGIIVDAKDEDAERFYLKYDFVTVASDVWSHRIFLPIETARAVFEERGAPGSHPG